MAYILYHNPGCGTSKKGLTLLQEAGVEPEIRKYMNVSERLSVDDLKGIAKKLGAKSPREFARAKDLERNGIGEDVSDEALYEAMADNPKLIQRPIGINGRKGVLGRPAEKLLDIV